MIEKVEGWVVPQSVKSPGERKKNVLNTGTKKQEVMEIDYICRREGTEKCVYIPMVPDTELE